MLRPSFTKLINYKPNHDPTQPNPTVISHTWYIGRDNQSVVTAVRSLFDTFVQQSTRAETEKRKESLVLRHSPLSHSGMTISRTWYSSTGILEYNMVYQVPLDYSVRIYVLIHFRNRRACCRACLVHLSPGTHAQARLDSAVVPVLSICR